MSSGSSGLPLYYLFFTLVKNRTIRLQNDLNTINFEVMDGRKRENIEIGLEVEVVLKKDQQSGYLTHGFVKRILTNSKFHPHGIKVMLDDGKVGRVQEII